MKLYTCTISEHTIDDYVTMFKIENKLRPREQSTVSHYYAKKLVNEAVGCGIRRVKFKYTETGKPYYDDKNHFSISHTGDYIFVAYSNKPVGIDGELVKKVNPRFIHKVLADGEIETNADFSIEFLKSWTIKEAFLKLNGDKMGNFQAITKQTLSDSHTIITNVTENYIVSAVYQI